MTAWLVPSPDPNRGFAGPATMPRRLRRLVVLLLAAVGVLLAAAPAASAHATLVDSDPADGARLATAPTTVTLTFDESVSIGSVGYLRVVGQGGRDVDAGRADHPGGDATRVAVALKSGLGDGTYTASFRIISADSHPVAGSIRFVVGNGALAAAAGGSATSVDSAASAVFDVIRWVTFAGLILLGGGWLLATVWVAGREDRRAQALLWSGWVIATVGGFAELMLQGPYTAGRGLGALWDWSLLNATLHTTYGTAHSARLLLLGVLGVTLAGLFRTRWRPQLAQICAALFLGVVVTYAVSGHASGQNPRWLVTLSDTLHLTAMSLWLGGLVYLVLAVLPRRQPAEAGAVLPTFSRVAFVCVVVLAVTGTYQAWLGIGSLDAITGTPYGQLVIVKVVLFAGLVALGNVSRLVVQRRWVRPVAYALADPPPPLVADPEAVEDIDVPDRMRRSVLAEVVIGLVVLAVTSVLVAEPPGRAAEALEAAKPRTGVTALGGGRTATITVTPGRHGPVTVDVKLTSGPKPVQLGLTAGIPARQLGPINVPMTSTAGSDYSASGVVIPAAGTWTFTLTVRTSDFDSVTADTAIRLS